MRTYYKSDKKRREDAKKKRKEEKRLKRMSKDTSAKSDSEVKPSDTPEGTQ